MHDLIQKNLERHSREIRDTCQRLNVRRLDVFGSVVSGEFDPAKSDIDFLVSFRQDYFRGIADTYLELAESLETIFGRSVDLLTERSIRNPYLKKAIDETRVPLYEA